LESPAAWRRLHWRLWTQAAFALMEGYEWLAQWLRSLVHRG
jgi:hypothetical protein